MLNFLKHTLKYIPTDGSSSFGSQPLNLVSVAMSSCHFALIKYSLGHANRWKFLFLNAKLIVSFYLKGVQAKISKNQQQPPLN